MDASAQLLAYLARIGLDAPPACDPAGLRQVQAAHRQTIAFENLDIALGRSLQCDAASVFAKLVQARRGGFCFEHNRLFCDMLIAMGFTARMLLARVLLGDPPALPPRTHCLVLVEFADGPWIADAGFGGSYVPPMALRHGEVTTSGDGARHRLTMMAEDADLPGSWLLEREGPKLATDGRARSNTGWEKQFAFDLAPVVEADLAMGHHWAATHPTSRFTQVKVASRCLPDGFASMVDGQLTVWRKGHAVEQRLISDAAACRTVLADQFGIELDESDTARLLRG